MRVAESVRVGKRAREEADYTVCQTGRLGIESNECGVVGLSAVAKDQLHRQILSNL